MYVHTFTVLYVLYYVNLCREVKFAVYMLVCTHWIACVWYIIACPSWGIGFMNQHICGTESWIQDYSMKIGFPLGNYIYTTTLE